FLNYKTGFATLYIPNRGSKKQSKVETPQTAISILCLLAKAKPTTTTHNSSVDMEPVSITGSGSGSGSDQNQFRVQQALNLIRFPDAGSRIRAAQEIRRLTKTSQQCRRQLATAIPPLVHMLRLHVSLHSSEAALLALLNLAVKDEENKMSILAAGALEPITRFLESENPTLQEYAAASLLTLSASSSNKPIIISASKTIPLLVKALESGTPQAKVDSIMALYNLSTHSHTINLMLDTNPIPSIIDLLKSSKTSSKTAEKSLALIESLVSFQRGRDALVSLEGGVLVVVEAIESGSHQTREHAVGALLIMCEAERCVYREPILREGVIPGLLELTVHGTPKAQSKAQLLLRLLRDPCYRSRSSDVEPDTIENIVCNIISQIDGEDQPGKAKKMLAEMVQVSMEKSLRHLQQRALVCTPSK
ncbi:hypothetical protein V2J09_003435, partial [Rumex salicifolius]